MDETDAGAVPRVIVAGSRTITDEAWVRQWLGMLLPDGATILSGCAQGPDTFAIRYARAHGLDVVLHPAKWRRDDRTLDRGAGVRRNQRMLDDGATDVIAFWDGTSRGTKDLIDRASWAGVPVVIVEPPRPRRTETLRGFNTEPLL